MGIIGLVLFLALLLSMFGSGLRLFRLEQDPFLRSLGLGFSAMIVGAMVLNLFGDRWTYLQVNGFVWVLLGCVARSRSMSQQTMAEGAAPVEFSPEPTGQGDPRVKLLVVGHGPEEDQVYKLSRDLGIAESCHFEGFRPNVEDWLWKMDILVLPSKTEALSNSLMEAMACGCCAVASNVGGNPELVVQGQTGLLFESGDVDGLTEALRRLVDQKALRLGLAEAGCQFVRGKFFPAAMAERMAAIYDRVLHRATSSAACASESVSQEKSCLV